MNETSARCVVLFARAPSEEGSAKDLSEAKALFAHARQGLAAAVAGAPDVSLVLVGAGPAPTAAHRLPQRGSSFGERLRNAFSDVRALGYDAIVMVPSDVPQLSTRELLEAFETLDRGHAVLGPSPDGGVYLLGLPADPGALLQDVRWRTSHVLADLQQRLGTRHTVHLLPALADVDDHADLRRLSVEDVAPELLALVFALLSSRTRRAARVRPIGTVLRPVESASRAPPAALAV